MTVAQQALIEWCSIDQRIVEIAVTASRTTRLNPPLIMLRRCNVCPKTSKTKFLVRLLEDEPHLGAKLRQRCK
ncbi:MAG: hypothetical protein R2854_09175 [Caldilineaceae bacterium]